MTPSFWIINQSAGADYGHNGWNEGGEVEGEGIGFCQFGGCAEGKELELY